MKVEQCMTRTPKACGSNDSLARAAQIMWDGDCGSVPVLDASARLVGMITDRDICMAAYTQGRSLSSISVASAMARKVYSCGPKQSVDAALKIMQGARVRRLPVLDAAGKLVGVFSLSDVWRSYQNDGRPKRKLPVPRGLPITMAAVSAPARSLESPATTPGTADRSARAGSTKSVLRPMPRRASKSKRVGVSAGAVRARPRA